MTKSPDAFRSIGEVSRLVGVAPHVLRYWEGQFSQLSPVKRADGRRYYRPDDVRLVAGLCQVMREEGLSIRGAKRLIAEDRGAALRRLGALRLGDGATDQTEALATPRLVLADEPAEAALTLQLDLTDAPAPPARAETSIARKRSRPAPEDESLPLFPEIAIIPENEWLGRLVATAAALGRRDPHADPLPAGARALRDGLRNAD
ncbi:MerR family transcriptional regulator [Paracoccus aminophilus]|uniref:Transcriptional regulator, MerR family n=1 Tax=Paracoccus aminophilus JCM 7686 TaxID=1367847 RepID=S5YSJ8_PARAH|nr:MerR family transcriptional regulator [Paracoccus aminophilus]AGT08201.1 transcriptional regulator, MerR family [Paracoccus aminophilus JCM 7686]